MPLCAIEACANAQRKGGGFLPRSCYIGDMSKGSKLSWNGMPHRRLETAPVHVEFIICSGSNGICNAMLDEKRIQKIAQEVASSNLASTNISSVSSSAAIDSEG